MTVRTDIGLCFVPIRFPARRFALSRQTKISLLGSEPLRDGTNSVRIHMCSFDFRPRPQLRLGGDHDRCSAHNIVTVASAPKLRVVQDGPSPASKKVARRLDAQPFGTGGPAGRQGSSFAKHSAAPPLRRVVARRNARGPGLVRWAGSRPCAAMWICGAGRQPRRIRGGIDPAITGEPSEERPVRLNEPNRLARHSLKSSGRASAWQAGWYRGVRAPAGVPEPGLQARSAERCWGLGRRRAK